MIDETPTRRCAAPRPVRLTLDAKNTVVKSRNVVAQTKTGDPHNVVVAGAHLDSAPDSPGINDDGSGVAAVLETAVQLGSSPTVTNAVRFVFWGAQQTGLQGSTKYVASLGRRRAGRRRAVPGLRPARIDQRRATSPSTATSPASPTPTFPPREVPAGSAGLERTLAGYLNLAGVRPADIPLGLASDYSAFLRAGIPIGGITTGSSQRKSATPGAAVGWQRRAWPSTRTINAAATPSPTSTGPPCRPPAPRSPSPSAPTRSRPRVPTESRPEVDSRRYAHPQPCLRAISQPACVGMSFVTNTSRRLSDGWTGGCGRHGCADGGLRVRHHLSVDHRNHHDQHHPDYHQHDIANIPRAGTTTAVAALKPAADV